MKTEERPLLEAHVLYDSLIALNKSHRAERAEELNILGLVWWAKECATVHCNIGRNTGKSSYICSRATERDLVIVKAKSLTVLYKQCAAMVITPEECQEKTYGRTFSTVWIDEPAKVFTRVSIERIYACCAHNEKQTFVLLGE